MILWPWWNGEHRSLVLSVERRRVWFWTQWLLRPNGPITWPQNGVLVIIILGKFSSVPCITYVYYCLWLSCWSFPQMSSDPLLGESWCYRKMGEERLVRSQVSDESLECTGKWGSWLCPAKNSRTSHCKVKAGLFKRDTHSKGFPSGSAVKNSSAMQETQESQVQSLAWEDPLEKDMATHSNILARIPGNPPVGYSPRGGSQRAGHDWVTNTFTFNVLPREHTGPQHLLKLNLPVSLA